MIETDRVKALFFDYGGMLDTPFMSWAEVYLHIYNDKLGLGLDQELFRSAYEATEQRMEKGDPIATDTSLMDTQLYKIRWQLEYLDRNDLLPDSVKNRVEVAHDAAQLATLFSEKSIASAFPVISELSKRYTLVLVSDYYGNLRQVVRDMGLAPYFTTLIDSKLIGIRKPDPSLWKIALDEAGYEPQQVIVIGNSMENDIQPALQLGCQAILGTQHKEESHDGITRISSLNELLLIL